MISETRKTGRRHVMEEACKIETWIMCRGTGSLLPYLLPPSPVANQLFRNAKSPLAFLRIILHFIGVIFFLYHSIMRSLFLLGLGCVFVAASPSSPWRRQDSQDDFDPFIRPSSARTNQADPSPTDQPICERNPATPTRMQR